MNIQLINSSDFDHSIIPNTLYKYREWNNDFDEMLLRNSELYFAPFKSFGSTNESGEFDFEYDEELINDEELYKFFYQHAEESLGISSHTKKHIYALDMTKNTLFKDPNYRDKIIAKTLDSLNESHGILSLSFDKNNYRLWNDFSNNHTGYTVGIDKDFMFKEGIIDCIAGYV